MQLQDKFGPIVDKLSSSPFSLTTYVNQLSGARTTDAQTGDSLHCTAENSIPIPNF